MTSSRIACSYCHKDFLKDNRHINENKKLCYNFYCSSKCQSSSKNKKIELVCERNNCQKKFKRKLAAISPHNFCSRRCAIVVHNEQKWGIKKPKKLLTKIEKREIWLKAHKKYWSQYWDTHNEDYVITKIQDFAIQNGRIPVKRELWGLYKPARKFFGTWNKAIEAAGFDPNPVLFAKRQIAKDGHSCDSLAEKLIDDYLFESGISHERNFPYPEGGYTADFKIGDILIEYFGLAGEHQRYDELKNIKIKLAKKYNLKLLQIYPKELYSRSGLKNIFYTP